MSMNMTRRWIVASATAMVCLNASAALASDLQKLVEELNEATKALSQANEDLKLLDVRIEEQTEKVNFLRKLAEKTEDPRIQKKFEIARMELEALEDERDEVKATVVKLTRHVDELRAAIGKFRSIAPPATT